MNLRLLMWLLVVSASGEASMRIKGFAKNRNSREIYPSSQEFPDRWIIQKLDHIYGSTNRRYLSNDEFHEDGGPIFIRLGGANQISSHHLQYEYFHDLAQIHKARLINLEHRYYGKSIPTVDLSVDNLHYLSTGQVLADIANFIVAIKNNSQNSKVILFGESYAGSLVVWMKHEYPELITGGWASSAPLLAKLDFSEYRKRIGEILRKVGGTECYEKIKNQIDKLLSTNESSLLQLCDDFDAASSKDAMSLAWNIATTYSMEFQEGHIPSICKSAVNSIDDDPEEMANWIIENSKCFQNDCLNASFANSLENINDIRNFNGDRQFFYQKCNEFGWFKTNSGRNDDQLFGPRTIPLSFFIQLCQRAFGKHITERFLKFKISITNNRFGGLDPNVNGIIMTQGEYDPWNIVGMRDPSKVLIISGAFHCDDVHSNSLRDSTPLRNAKREVAKFIKNLLN